MDIRCNCKIFIIWILNTRGEIDMENKEKEILDNLEVAQDAAVK